ncbi:MAG: hypothetical protein WAW37_19485, partial [Syntrophobacteraceae bacterium]
FGLLRKARHWIPAQKRCGNDGPQSLRCMQTAWNSELCHWAIAPKVASRVIYGQVLNKFKFAFSPSPPRLRGERLRSGFPLTTSRFSFSLSTVKPLSFHCPFSDPAPLFPDRSVFYFKPLFLSGSSCPHLHQKS